METGASLYYLLAWDVFYHRMQKNRGRKNFLFIAEKPGLRFLPAVTRMKSKEQNISGQGQHRPGMKRFKGSGNV